MIQQVKFNGILTAKNNRIKLNSGTDIEIEVTVDSGSTIQIYLGSHLTKKQDHKTGGQSRPGEPIRFFLPRLTEGDLWILIEEVAGKKQTDRFVVNLTSSPVTDETKIVKATKTMVLIADADYANVIWDTSELEPDKGGLKRLFVIGGVQSAWIKNIRVLPDPNLRVFQVNGSAKLTVTNCKIPYVHDFLMASGDGYSIKLGNITTEKTVGYSVYAEARDSNGVIRKPSSASIYINDCVFNSSERETPLRTMIGTSTVINNSTVMDTVDIGARKRTSARFHGDVEANTCTFGWTWQGPRTDSEYSPEDIIPHALFINCVIEGGLRLHSGTEKVLLNSCKLTRFQDEFGGGYALNLDRHEGKVDPIITMMGVTMLGKVGDGFVPAVRSQCTLNGVTW